jgi:putative ABC transport system permease protein
MNDFRFALRQLLKSPGFTAVAVLTLALGIGANTAIFSVVNATFLRALPYPEPGRLVHLAERNQAGDTMPVSYPNFLDWQKQQGVFSNLAAFHEAEGRLKTGAGTEMVSVLHVSAEFFNVLGVRPAQGRELRPDDDLPGAARVAWVTHDGWQRVFNGDPNLVGRAVDFDGQALVIAGILPREYRFYRQSALVTALAPFAREFFIDVRENHSNTEAIARLKPGISLATARAQMNAIGARLADAYPDANQGLGIEATSLRERLAGDSRATLFILLGAVGLVLLIACVNVANMLLARSLARGREMAIRAALGASRRQVLRQLLVESLVLASIGGAAGALVGWWGFNFAGRLVPGEVRSLIADGAFDWRMLIFVVAVVLATGMAFGLAPAWQISQLQLVDALKLTTHEVRSAIGRFRMGDLLVVGQVTLALMLLVGAGLMIRSLHRLLQVDAGYEATQVLTLEVTAPPVEQFQRDPGMFARHYERVVEAVRNLPGVETAAVASGLPFTFSRSTILFYRQDQPAPDPGQLPAASQHSVSPEYFRAMGIPLRQGRLFDGTEPILALPPGTELAPQHFATIFQDLTLYGVISQKMADRFWPGEDAVGRRFRLGSPNFILPSVEVVGVVGNTVQSGLDQGEQPEFYLSLKQWPVPVGMHLVLRTPLEPATLVNSVRAAVASAAPDAVARDFRVLSERISDSTAGRRFNRDLLASFAATALLLALIGLYGVLAFNVGRRTREIGIRMALGASRRAVIRGVIGRGLALVLPGIGLGLAGAWGLGRAFQNQLYEIESTDPLAFCVGAGLMLVIALLAAWLPAQRAAKVEPVEALRTE